MLGCLFDRPFGPLEVGALRLWGLEDDPTLVAEDLTARFLWPADLHSLSKYSTNILKSVVSIQPNGPPSLALPSLSSVVRGEPIPKAIRASKRASSRYGQAYGCMQDVSTHPHTFCGKDSLSRSPGLLSHRLLFESAD